MKKLILLSLFLSLFMFSCKQVTPEEAAQKRMDERIKKELQEESRFDSLTRVAFGEGKFKYQRANRQNALDILKKELGGTPSMDSLFNTMQEKIYLECY